MTPSREEIEAAIKTATIWSEDIPETSGILIQVKKLRALIKAARWALELVDDDNPPLLPEEIEQLKPKEKEE